MLRRRETTLPERGPLIRGPRDTICKLEARAWPLTGRWDLFEPAGDEGLPSPPAAAAAAAAEPIETIEMDRRWPLLGACRSGAFEGGHGVESDRWRDLEEGTPRDRLDRCPRADGGGARPEPGRGRAEELWSGDDCLGRSELCWRDDWDGPLEEAAVEEEDEDDGVGATFLKVILHLTSSPAKTVWPYQRMKTLMLPGPSGDMVMLPPGEGEGGARVS